MYCHTYMLTVVSVSCTLDNIIASDLYRSQGYWSILRLVSYALKDDDL